jgi:hypothetical protein
MNQPTEVIAYRNPGEYWYWHNLDLVWGFIALLALAIYLVFWIPVFISFRKDIYNVRSWWEAFLLTLFWPITLPIIKNS